MSTKPRMSAPIARVRIKTAERRRPPSGTGRWRPTDPPVEAESRSHDDIEPESSRPPFYPFPLRNDGEP